MQLTDRINRIQISPTAAVIAEADKLKAKGVDIADFGPGEPDFPTPDHIKRAAIRAIEENLDSVGRSSLPWSIRWMTERLFIFVTRSRSPNLFQSSSAVPRAVVGRVEPERAAILAFRFCTAGSGSP